MTSRRLNNYTNIAILGAGSIGCYIGGFLLASGFNTLLIGRSRIQEQLVKYGLNVTDWRARDEYIESSHITFSLAESSLSQADFILVTVKSGDSEEAARSIAKYVKPNAIVVSLQNGVHNVEKLSAHLPNHSVLKGMVPFNVLAKGKGQFHCGTSGNIALEDKFNVAERLVKALNTCGFSVDNYDDLESVQWSKLLMNLNNAINALSGLPLKEQLQNCEFRSLLSRSIKEGLSVLKAADIKPVKVGKVSPTLLPYVLTLPNALFNMVASSMLKIDPTARSSMYEDLALKRKTEIDAINGEIIQLGKRYNVLTPVNSAITNEIRKAEEAKQGSPNMTSAELNKAIL